MSACLTLAGGKGRKPKTIRVTLSELESDYLWYLLKFPFDKS